MKKFSLLILSLLVMMSLFSSQAFAEELRVAMLLPGPINDGGWNESAYESLKEVEEKLGAEIAYSEKTNPSEFESIFEGYAAEGYDVVIGHGFEFGDAAKKVAKQFKDVKFIVTSSDITQEPNLASFQMDDKQAGFMQGVIAAILTETGKVGTIGGEEIPPIRNQQAGFEAGAKYINSDIEITTNYTGSFSDLAKAKEMAYAMIENDIDVIVEDADEAGKGVIEAAEEEEGIKVIGSTGDKGDKHPKAVVTSMVEDFPEGFLSMIQTIEKGEFKPQTFSMGFESDAISIAPYRAYEDELSEQDKEKIGKIVDKIKNGEINVQEFIEE